MRSEQVTIKGCGATRDDAMEVIHKRLQQYAPGQAWDQVYITARPSVLSADGSVRLWDVEASFERRSR